MKKTVLQTFSSLSSKKEILKGRTKLPAEQINALQYIEENTDAKISDIIEEALKKFNIVKKAHALEKEISQKTS